jgi:acyl-coenzyme A synthetase/AMP-(fatty) acid ligase
VNSAEVAPEEVLRHFLRSPDPHAAIGPWHIRWDLLSRAERNAVLQAEIPDVVTVSTSGSSGAPTSWSRSREQLLHEAELLAELWRDTPVDLMVAFAPPVHLWGLLTTLLVPAVIGTPVWFPPGFDAPGVDVTGMVVGVAAIPWTFRIMHRHQEVFVRAAGVTIMHSTATLPPDAEAIAADLSRARITEVFGSTESGGIAHRTCRDAPWTLFPDVRFVFDHVAGEVPLVVTGPRLASGLTTWDTGDFVDIVSSREFRFHGKRTRLRKINGVRVDLDVVEHHLREAVTCRDVACVPVEDAVRGESFTVLLVPDAKQSSPAVSVRIALKQLGLAPHDVRLVDHINRSETGKLRG